MHDTFAHGTLLPLGPNGAAEMLIDRPSFQCRYEMLVWLRTGGRCYFSISEPEEIFAHYSLYTFAGASANSECVQMQQQSEGEDSEEEGELDPADYEDEDEASENGQGAAPADAKQVNDPTWKINQPRTQPLAYWVPSDASGGEIWKSIQFTVDFTSRASVNKANKARRLSIWRAKNILGLHDQMKRPSTKGREYTDQNYQWILAEHAQHAAINNNERIPLDNLTTRYNQRFPTENRTTASLTSYIDRKSGLNAARKTYDSRQR